MLSGGDYRFFLKMCPRHDQSYRARERKKIKQVRSGFGAVLLGSLSTDGELRAVVCWCALQWARFQCERDCNWKLALIEPFLYLHIFHLTR